MKPATKAEGAGRPKKVKKCKITWSIILLGILIDGRVVTHKALNLPQKTGRVSVGWRFLAISE